MKFTVVSFAPYAIKEIKPSLIPHEFSLPASDTKIPSLLIVGRASSPLHLVGQDQTFQVPVSEEDLAKDIVNAHLIAQPEYDNEAHPAVFYLAGELTVEQVLAQKEIVSVQIKKQIRWFLKLIKQADDMWSIDKRKRFISDKHRLAAKHLGIKKEWVDITADEVITNRIELTPCPFCTVNIPAAAVICMNCKQVVNEEKYKNLTSQNSGKEAVASK